MLYCGSITYSFSISPAASFVTFSSVSKTITYYTDNNADVFKYTLILQGTLPNLVSVSNVFALTVQPFPNKAPYFKTNIRPLNIFNNQTYTLALPLCLDYEND